MELISTQPFTILAFGFILGLKHALDADHLIAVATLVSERKGILGSSVVGFMWGVGHTATLLAVGIAVVALGVRIPEQVGLAMEFAVAVMLVVLGVRVIWNLRRGATLHVHVHSHHGHTHIHPHVHPWSATHEHPESVSHHESHIEQIVHRVFARIRDARRSLIIGMIHGLAGSGALMLIVLATIPSSLLGLTYILVFGLGSVGGMVVMSACVGVPFVLSARGPHIIEKGLRAVAAALSIGFGLMLAYQIGFAEGLFIR